MPKPEREPDVLHYGTDYCECGYHIPPHGVRPTELWAAVHRARHLRWLGPRSIKEWRDVADALQVAVEEYELLADRLKEQMFDLRDEVERRLLRDIAERDDRIEDLLADLDAAERFGDA